MDVTPKKLLNSDKNCFICSVAVNSKQRMRAFKSGSKGISSGEERCVTTLRTAV